MAAWWRLAPLFRPYLGWIALSLLAAGAMFGVGLIDDVRDMSAPAKMAGQVLAASILYFSGVTMYELKIPPTGARPSDERKAFSGGPIMGST